MYPRGTKNFTVTWGHAILLSRSIRKPPHVLGYSAQTHGPVSAKDDPATVLKDMLLAGSSPAERRMVLEIPRACVLW